MTSSNFLGRSTARSAGKVLKNAERFFSAVPSAEGRFVAPVVVGCNFLTAAEPFSVVLMTSRVLSRLRNRWVEANHGWCLLRAYW